MKKRGKIIKTVHKVLIAVILLSAAAGLFFGVVVVDNHTARITMGQQDRSLPPEISGGQARLRLFGREYVLILPTQEAVAEGLNIGYTALPPGLRLIGRILHEGINQLTTDN